MTVASCPLPSTCEVAVVGAGIVGTALGARLAAAGFDVCVLDRAGPAAGASSTGEGNLLVSDKLPGPELALAKRSLLLWHELGESAGRSIELQDKGGLLVAWDEAELEGLRAQAEAQRAEGVSASSLAADEVRRLEPALSPEVAGGVFYPEDCQVQPVLVVGLQAKWLAERGGRLSRGAEVVGGRRNADGAITHLLTSRGSVSVGRWVIDAAGAWSGVLAGRLGGRVPVEPRKGHVLVTEPLPPLLRHKVYEAGYMGSVHDALGAGPAGSCAAVIEGTPAGTVLIGSSREYVGFLDGPDHDIVAEIARRALALVPSLLSVRLMRTYTGFRPATPDCLPVIGLDPDVPNLVHATGHEGAGILLSQVTAELVECLVTGREPPVDLAPFGAGRFAGLPGRDTGEPARASRRPPATVAGGPGPTARPPAGADHEPVAGDEAAAGDAAAGGPAGPAPRTSALAGLAHFSFDGRRLAAPAGTSVAGALLYNGERSWRVTRRTGRARGLFCGIGNCFDCLVDLPAQDDGGGGGSAARRTMRACLLPVREGARVRTSRSVGTPAPPGGHLSGETGGHPSGETGWHPSGEGGAAGSSRPAGADVAVVGAGPAGMAAAAAAASRGAQVVLVDSGARLGGQFFRQPLADAPGAPAGLAPPAGPHLPERWHSLAGHPSVRLLLGSEVWSASADGDGFLLRLAPQPDGRAPAAVRCRALVLAAGASELTLPFPGWDLPAVVTAGAAQTLVKAQGLSVGGRVVVAGTGPFLLPVAAALAGAGARVTVAEAAPLRSGPRALPALLAHPAKLAEAARYATALALSRVRFLSGRAVVRAEGGGRVERVVLARLGPGWVPLPGTEEVIAVDALCVSQGFVPRVELARQLGAREVPHARRPAPRVAWGEDMGTSVPGLFVAGELAGVAGAEVAEMEGGLAGHSAASYLGFADGRSASDRRALALRLRAARAFARRLDALYPLGLGWLTWLSDETVFCRCEDVTWGTVREALRGGAATVREVRGLTRCGMGYCQGRTCGPPLQLAVSALTERPFLEVGDLHKRPVAVPVPLAAVARPAPAAVAGPPPA